MSAGLVGSEMCIGDSVMMSSRGAKMEELERQYNERSRGLACKRGGAYS